jgi:hypothetical protein
MKENSNELINLFINCEIGEPENGTTLPDLQKCIGLLSDYLSEKVENSNKKPINKIITISHKKEKIRDMWLVVNELIQNKD